MYDEALQYDCIDCGRHVVTWGYLREEMTRCSTCRWITEEIPRQAQPAVRARLDVVLKSDTEECGACFGTGRHAHFQPFGKCSICGGLGRITNRLKAGQFGECIASPPLTGRST